MAFVPLVFQPDLDCNWEAAPGALVDCRGFVPTRRGGLASWQMESVVASYTSSTEPVAAGIVRKADGTARFFIFNKQSIYEYDSTTTATNRSAATYSASTTDWCWTQFGDTTIAVNLYDNPQSSSAGAFAALGGSPPKAQCVASNLGFVMLGNYNDGTAYPDGWACSALENITSWTASSATQAARGRLYDTPGPIRALAALRDSIIAYKDDSIYVGEYVGDTSNGIIWAWRLISDKVGCSSPNGIGVFNDMHYFLHRSGFYVFDGTAVRRIGRECTNHLFDTIAGATGGITFSKTQVSVDQTQNIVMFAMRAASETKITTVYCYNVETNRWSYIFGATIFTAAAGSSDYPTAIVRCTQSDLIAFDANLSDDNPPTAVMIGPDSTGKIAAMYPSYGTPATDPTIMALQTGPIGDGDTHVDLTGVKPRLYSYTAGTAPTMTVGGDKDESNVIDGTASIATGTWNTTELRFDVKTSARYVAPRMVFTNGLEVAGLQVFPAYGKAKR